MLYGAKKTTILPDTSCKIISNIMDNSIHFQSDLDFIIASVGKEKCDSCRIFQSVGRTDSFWGTGYLAAGRSLRSIEWQW